MSKAADLRDRARAAVERARRHVDAGDETALRYACLELRFAVEFLTYSLLQVYLAEVPEETVKKWTPRDVIGELLNADERADQSVRLYVGLEREPGVPADTMRDIGEESRLSRRQIVRFHNAMGNFLHAPTLEQLEGDGVSMERLRAKVEEVALALEQVLSSPVFNLNFGNFVTFHCSECQSPIKRKVEGIDPKLGIVCRRTACGAIYDMNEVDGRTAFSLRHASGRCPKCSGEWKIPVHRVAVGETFRCECGSAWQISFAVREVVPSSGQEPEQRNAS